MYTLVLRACVRVCVRVYICMLVCVLAGSQRRKRTSLFPWALIWSEMKGLVLCLLSQEIRNKVLHIQRFRSEGRHSQRGGRLASSPNSYQAVSSEETGRRDTHYYCCIILLTLYSLNCAHVAPECESDTSCVSSNTEERHIIHTVKHVESWPVIHLS